MSNKKFPMWVKYQWRRKKNLRLWFERFLAGPSWHQVAAAVVLFAGVFLLVSGIHYGWDFGMAFADMSGSSTLRNTAYSINNVVIDPSGTATLTVQDVEPKPAGELIWVYILGSIVLSGLLIATITNVLRSWVDRFKQGTVSYWSFRRHTVILGYNDMAPGIIERLCGNRKYPEGIRIVVGVKKSVHEVETQLSNHLSERQRCCVVVLQADSCNRRDLRRLRIRRAKEVYILGEHDDANSLNSYRKIQELCGKRRMPECHVQVQFQSTFALFQTYTKKEGQDHFHTFNFHDVWARQMVMRPEIDTREDGKVTMSPDSSKHVHLVIVGMTEMGEALAREAAFLCHYPNYVTRNLRTQITFIDPQAKEQMTYFMGRYHHLFDLCNHTFRGAGETPSYPMLEKDFLDLDFEFIQANVADMRMRKELKEWAEDENQLLTIAVCADLPHRSMAASLYLPDEIFERKIPVWVYQPAKGDMKEYLGHSRFENIITFGMSGKELDIRNEAIVSQAKRLNHFYWHCSEEVVKYDPAEIEREWSETKIFDKWSNIYNTSAIHAKMRCIGGVEKLGDYIDVLAQVEHNRWMAEKLLMGFRPTTAAEHRQILADPKLKKTLKNRFIHDDIRPFDELPAETTLIDRKFTREMPNIMAI